MESDEFGPYEEEAKGDAANARMLADVGVYYTSWSGALDAGDDNNIEEADAEVAAEID